MMFCEWIGPKISAAMVWPGRALTFLATLIVTLLVVAALGAAARHSSGVPIAAVQTDPASANRSWNAPMAVDSGSWARALLIAAGVLITFHYFI